MLNEDAIDLYDRTPVGTKVVVLPDRPQQAARTRHREPRPAPQREQVAHTQDPRPLAAVQNPNPSQLMFGSSAARIY
jgi:hypothetical protein